MSTDGGISDLCLNDKIIKYYRVSRALLIILDHGTNGREEFILSEFFSAGKGESGVVGRKEGNINL
jgi:hypothetical protein